MEIHLILYLRKERFDLLLQNTERRLKYADLINN